MKAGATVGRDFFAGFEPLRRDLGAAAVGGWLVYGGERAEQRREARVLPWSKIGELAEALAE